MTLEHAAIWTERLEVLKDYYVKYFGAVSNDKYINPSKAFESYFLSFELFRIRGTVGTNDHAGDSIKHE